MMRRFSRTIVGAIFFAGVVAFAGAAESWLGRGPVVFEAAFPQTTSARWEPLLSLGEAGAGDVLFCRRLADGRMVFGWERVGSPAVISDPIVLENKPTHHCLVSLGSLMPVEAGTAIAPPLLDMLRGIALIQCDGHTILMVRGDFAAAKSNAVLGKNEVGGSFAGAFFSGQISSVAPASLKSVLSAAVNPVRLVAEEEKTTPEAREFPGPIKLRVMFPGNGAGHNEPLVVSGITAAGDIVYVIYGDNQHLRLGYDHWMVGGPVSAPLSCDVMVPHEVVISVGSLFPPVDPARPDSPAVAALRERCVVMLDGKVVLNTAAKFYPTTPEQITLFTNTIGGSTADTVFTGSVLRVERVRPEDILRAAPKP